MFQSLLSRFSPLSSMRITLPITPEQLESRLHLITQHLISAASSTSPSPSTPQFSAWMHLQSTNSTHQILSQLYQSLVQKSHSDCLSPSDQLLLISIYQFYTLLLINCKDQLLLCKLVSDEFVIELCKLGLAKSMNSDMEAYQINLIKGYLQGVTYESVKYMVIRDRFWVFQVCVGVFVSKLGTGTVEFTTMSNVMLNVIKKVDGIGFLWENVWGVKGLQLGFMEGFAFIAKLIGKKSQQCQMGNAIRQQVSTLTGQTMQSLEQITLFFIQLRTSVNTPSIIEQIQQYCYLYLEQILQNVCGEIVGEGVEKRGLIQKQEPKQKQKQEQGQGQKEIQQIKQKEEQKQKINQIYQQQQIQSSTELQSKEQQMQQSKLAPKTKNNKNWIIQYSILFPLWKTYGMELDAIQAVIQRNDGFQQFLQWFQYGDGQQQNKQGFKPKIDGLACRAMFVLSKIVQSKYSHLSERIMSITDQQEVNRVKQLRERILKILIQKIFLCIEQIESTPPAFLLHFIRNLLLTIFFLKLAITQSSSLSQSQSPLLQSLSESILQLFLTQTAQLKKLMKNTQKWNSIISWYEQCSNKVTSNLLHISDTYQQISEQQNYLTMLLYQYVKNFRYMIVDTTTLDPKAIKQEKFYHTTFSSKGIEFQPGKIVRSRENGGQKKQEEEEQKQEGYQIKVVCPCLFHFNYQQIPVVVIEDKQCLIVAVKNSDNSYKIMINVQFKDIDGLIYGTSQSSQPKSSTQLPKFIKINLRGSQQIILQFTNPKVVGNLFKDYLIKSRDMMRQRQLTFLNNWIKDYQIDTQKCLQQVKMSLKKDDYRLP